MKKVIFLTFALALVVSSIYSCTPENLIDATEEQACCGEGENIPPPPPPPDSTTGG